MYAHRPRHATIAILILALVIVTVLGETAAQAPTGNPTQGQSATATPYHEGVPRASVSPHAMEPTRYPLPGPEDRASANAMATGSTAMIDMARAMDESADLLLHSNKPELVDVGRHWALDAQALRRQAAWMLLSATAADMIHDPATDHELNARNLKGNGMAMSAEGQAMVEHGRAMTSQIEQLRATGALPPDLAGELDAAGMKLIASGEELEQDGLEMESTADQMLALIGQ